MIKCLSKQWYILKIEMSIYLSTPQKKRKDLMTEIYLV